MFILYFAIKGYFFMGVSVYSGFWYRYYFMRIIKRQYMRDMDVDIVPNGIIVNEHVHGFGVFDENFRFVKSSIQMRKNNGQFIPRFNHDDIPFVDKDVVFVGNVYPQFGHFLLEHMNRAWVFTMSEYKNAYVVLINNQDINPVPEYMYEFLRILGVPRERVIILNETTRFRNVFVPHQGFNIPVYSSDEFAKTFDRIAQNVENLEDVFDKVYLSRDALKERRTYGEKYIAKIFEKNGFHVVCPETLSLEKQVSIVKNCRVLAGCAGTALHLALFMKPGGTVIQIKRNRRCKDNAPIQHLINITKKLNGIFISGSIEKTPSSHYENVPQIIGLNKFMRKFFDENNFVYDNNLPNMDQSTWDEYTQKLAEYRSAHGNATSILLRQFLVRVSALFVPGRERRGAWRRWVKKKLHLT